MPERKAIIASRTGLHARPAAEFVKAAGRQPVPVFIGVGDRAAVRADSLLRSSAGSRGGRFFGMSQPFDTSVTDRLLSTTRAVRKRLDLDRPVEREVLTECLRLAIQAPTGGNRQGWHWVVVTDADKRAGLAELYRAGAEIYFGARAQNAEPPTGRQARVVESALHLVEVMARVPALVIPCIEGRVTDVRHAAGFFGSIHPAIWSFQLALRSRGLGSAWTTLHLAHEQQAAELLGIPYEMVTQAALVPVAYTIGTEFKPAERRPVEEITHWDSWA